MGPLGTATIIQQRRGEVSEQGTSAARQETSSLLGIGLVKICGEDRVETRDALHLELGGNIELQCTRKPLCCVGSPGTSIASSRVLFFFRWHT